MKKFVTLSETSAKAPQITGGGNSREMGITETSIVRRDMDGVSSAFRRAVVGLLSRRASDEHPMSTRSASDGTLRKRGLIQHIAAVFMLLFFVGVGNVWATIDWTDYAVDKEGLTTGQRYYLYTNNTSGTYTTNHFVMAPASYPTTSAGRSNYVTDDYARATIFTFTKNQDGTYIISYKEGNNTRYFNANWGTYNTKGITTSNWNTTSADWTIADVTSGTTTYKNTLKTGSKYIFVQKNSTSTFMTTTTSSNKPFWPYMFISENAYADATAPNQFYYTVSTAAYTDGVESTDGGSVGVVPVTYAKPEASDWDPNDFSSSIAKRQKGSSGTSVLVSFYSKISPNSGDGYEFVGFQNGSVALTEGEAIAADHYWKVDEGNNIYRVTIEVNGSNASPTDIALRANYAAKAEPVANVYDANEESTGYRSLAEALAAAENGYRVELLTDIENVSSTIAINKNITFDFNGHRIIGASTDAPDNLVTITGGNVIFVDNTTTPGGVSTTGNTAVLVNGGSLTIENGVYQAANSAINQSAGTVTIHNGGFTATSNLATQDLAGSNYTINGGYFVHKLGYSIPEGYAQSSDLPYGAQLKYSSANYNYMVVSKSSPNYPLCTVISKDGNGIKAKTNFITLESAISYVNNTVGNGYNKVILLHEDYTLPNGNFNIPSNATLVVPYKEDQKDATPVIDKETTDDTPTHAYCTLTLSSGTHLEVYGALEVSGLMTTGSQNAKAIARPGGDTYGLMLMPAGSSITLNEDARLYAWGFIQGEGTIDARRGAVVREQFQITDWKTVTPTAFMCIGYSVNYQMRVLPINQYFVQNVEVKTTYRPGSRLLAQVSANVFGMKVAFNDVGFIGIKYSAEAKAEDKTLVDDVAIFLMDNEDDSEDTWVRKSYDIAHDQQLYEVNNSAYMGSLQMLIQFNPPIYLGPTFGNIDDIDMDSRAFMLALTNNFKIHLLSGNLQVTQDTEMLPGSVIEIEKKSTLTINNGQTLHLYDAAQWGEYVSNYSDHASNTINYGYATRIVYRPGGVPTVRDISSAEGLGDAQLIVHGSVDVKGYLNTTVSDYKATYTGKHQNDKDSKYYPDLAITQQDQPGVGGASIISTIADAGTVKFSTKAKSVSHANTRDFLWQVSAPSTTDDVTYIGGDLTIPALLRNGDGSTEGAFAETANTAAGKSFCYMDINDDGIGEWKNLTNSGCFYFDENNVYYIKPQAYIPISMGEPEEEADHTYRDHYAGTHKIYIQMDGCQWWEVEAVAGQANLFHCVHPLNDTYYYYDNGWKEKRFNVTFRDWDGTKLIFVDKNGVKQDHYELTYHTMPQWFGQTPSRETDNYYTYEFAGWTPTPAPVEQDIEYTATFNRTPREFLVTFKDQAGNLIENRYLPYGSTPECLSHTLASNEQWRPAIGIVTKDVTYTLEAKDEAGPFTITFVNWNGEVLQSNDVALNTTPSYTGAAPSKTALSDEEYVFSGWTPAIVPATANAVYTASYTTGPKTYTVRFYKEGTTEATKGVAGNLLAARTVAYGEMPELPDPLPSKDATDAKTYTLVWSPLVSAATQNQDYIATFTETTRQYPITWKNYDGTTIATTYSNYNTTPEYTGVTPSKPSDGENLYNFSGWSPAIAPVTGAATYTAQYNATELDIVKTVTNSDSDYDEYNEFDVLTIEKTGSVQAEGKTITTDVLIIKSNDTIAGSLHAAAVNATQAYFDLTLNAKPRHWYSFGVPWTIDLDQTPLKEVESGRTFVLGRDYDIVYYDGAIRAAQGPVPQCWKYVEYESHVLRPGKGYMILFTSNVRTVRFAKKANSSVIFSGNVYAAENPVEGEGTDHGWNGIANPMTYKADLKNNGAIMVGQVYDNGEIGADSYDPVYTSAMIVGKAIYVQVDNAVSFTSAHDITPAAAPVRFGRKASTDKKYMLLEDYYSVSVKPADGGKEAKVYILPEEDKENKYIIGHDLMKMGISNKVVQVWVNRYNAKLCLNTTAPQDEMADYPLGIFVPEEGDYTLTLDAQPDQDYTLYITRDGDAIWNLSTGAYTTHMQKGTDSHYGLRLSSKVLEIYNGIDEALVDAKGETRKVLVGEKVYIIRENRVYTVEGQLVK